MGTAIVFPGQGSQYVGMGSPLKDTESIVARTLVEADEALGFGLSRVMQEGPDEYLAETSITQPAILTLSVAMWRLLQDRHPTLAPVAAAGHSLGEYSALVAGGSIDFADAVRLVHLRGKSMQEAVPVGQGSMAAIVGLDVDTVRLLCDEVQQGHSQAELVVEPASLNCPGQIVVAGHREAVDRVVERAREMGSRSAIPLNVSAPFHCRLLEPARRALAEALDRIEVRKPAFPIVQNVDAAPHTDPAQIRANLVAQVVQPVLWEACSRRLLALGADRFLELGPGRTIAGLMKKVDRRIDVISLDRTGAWEQVQV